MPTYAEIQTEIASMLSIPDEELTEGQKQLMEDYLDELADQEAAKVDGFAQFIRLEEARAKAMEEEAKRLNARAKSAEGRLAWLKEKYVTTMQTYGLTKVQGTVYTLSLRKSEAVAITAMVDSLPEAYRREKVTVEPNKTSIKDALKAGEIIPGCELVTIHSLQIR